jgi:hypothetical protein
MTKGTYQKSFVFVTMFPSEYDDENLFHVITAIQEDANLKVMDAKDDVVEVLSMLNEDKCKDSYFLSRVNELLLYKHGIQILCLKNSKNPSSGRSIHIEIKSLRTELIRRANEKSGGWLYTLGGVATFLLSGWTFYKNM